MYMGFLAVTSALCHSLFAMEFAAIQEELSPVLTHESQSLKFFTVPHDNSNVHPLVLANNKGLTDFHKVDIAKESDPQRIQEDNIYINAREPELFDEFKNGKKELLVLFDGAKLIAGSYYFCLPGEKMIWMGGTWFDRSYHNEMTKLIDTATSIITYYKKALETLNFDKVGVGMRKNSKDIPLLEVNGFKADSETSVPQAVHSTNIKYNFNENGTVYTFHR